VSKHPCVNILVAVNKRSLVIISVSILYNILKKCAKKSIPIKMDVCVYVCMSGHNSGTPGAISTKLGTHIAICMYKNLIYVVYIYIYCAGRQGIWMILIIEEIKLLLLPGNRLVTTSRLATVGQTYPRKHIVSAKM
jgi:hypothetical protein